MSFPENATSANPVFFRTYSRTINGKRESWEDVCDRTATELARLGKFTESESNLILQNQLEFKTLTSGRWLWVGGTDYARKSENYYSAYNCESRHIDSIQAIVDQFNLAMQGCGTGTVLERDEIAQLGVVTNRIEVKVLPVGELYREGNMLMADPDIDITVGDSRQGWVSAYEAFLEAFFSEIPISELTIDLRYVRPAGIPLKGFGGVSNPSKLPDLWVNVAKILNGAVGRSLTPEEVCLILDNAAQVVVAGSIRRSANIRQFDSDAPLLKKGLYTQDSDGNWSIDPDRAPLRMSNHTRVYHQKPTLEECTEAVREQYFSGEGAIQWAGEAVARANADLLGTADRKREFLWKYAVEGREAASAYLGHLSALKGFSESRRLLQHRMTRYGLNPCFAAGTMILGREGHFPIETLVGKTVQVWDGETWVEIDNFRVTGENQPVYTVTLHDGSKITATKHHRFILDDGSSKELGALIVGDRLLTHGQQKHDDPLYIWNQIKSIEFSHVADKVYCCTVPTNNQITLANLVVTGQCGEIIMRDNFCNLTEVHLNLIDPNNLVEQSNAFKAAALSACALLHHNFVDEVYAYSRIVDPIIGVSFTGLFDFFVNYFGVPWLQWWQAGRPRIWGLLYEDGSSEADYFRRWERWTLTKWRETVELTVLDYCRRHGIPRPNRCTTVQPAGSKSLLTNASPGWHPPKAAWYIRRITFRRDDPVALACRDYGYRIVPGQNDIDENGNLLNDPFDPRCTEWLVEIPTKTSWADLHGVESIDISKFSAAAQFDFYMTVQKYYVTHNASATIEIREHEIEEVGQLIHKAIAYDEGYISATLLARFDDTQTFPRLPFEPVSSSEYFRLQAEVLEHRKGNDFLSLLNQYDAAPQFDVGAAPCDSDKCLI